MATNLTPFETAEEGAYTIFTIVSVSLLINGILMLGHMMMFHATFSIFFAIAGGSGLIGSFLFPWLKRKRFGERNRTYGERIWSLEQALGEAV